MHWNSILSGFSFSLFNDIHDWTEASIIVDYSVQQHLLDAMAHTADYQHRRENEELHVQTSHN